MVGSVGWWVGGRWVGGSVVGGTVSRLVSGWWSVGKWSLDLIKPIGTIHIQKL